MTTPKPLVLLIDDEERILRSLAMLLRPYFRIIATTDPAEALAAVSRERVHVIVSDQKMPLMRGAELLREVRQRSPETMRILLTGYSELDAIMASVNEGEIFRYVNKPWDGAELRATVEQAAAIALASEGLRDSFAATETPSAPQAPTNAGILVLDDDRAVFDAVREIVGNGAAVVHATSLEGAFAALERDRIGIIVSELGVGGEDLAPALKLLKAQHPEVVTIVLTPFADTSVLIDLINEGQIFRVLPKPVRRGPLSMSIASAQRQQRVLSASPQLRQRHQVAPMRRPEETRVASRVMGLLGRLRGRPSA